MMIYDPARHKQFINKHGHVVAWPLYSPAVPEYGDWSFVDIKYIGTVAIPQVIFIRQLVSDEVNQIRRQYMVWGVKMNAVPWACVLGMPDTFGVETGVYGVVSTTLVNRSVGV